MTGGPGGVPGGPGYGVGRAITPSNTDLDYLTQAAQLATAKATSAAVLSPGATINGILFTGAAPITITSGTTHVLTLGAGLSGGSFNGSVAVTATVTGAPWSGVTGTPTSLAGYGITSPLNVAQGGTAIASYTIGDTLYASGATTLSTLGIGAANTVLTSSGSQPQWSTTIAYAALPTGNGSWDAGAGNATTITRTLTVNGPLITNGDVDFTGGTTQVSFGNNTLAASTTMIFNTAAGNLRQLNIETGGVLRWIVRLADNAAESGADAGSNFGIFARHDDGSNIGTALAISRADMHATFSGLLIANAGLTVSNGQTLTMTGVTFAGVSTVSGRFGFTNATPFTLTNGQTLSVTQTAQTVGAATLTIPNFASVSDTFAFITLAQTLSNKTLASPKITGLVTQYNAVATAGFGVPAIYASGRKTAQTAASGTVCTFTPAADGTFQIGANVLVTAATLASFTVTCTYTSEDGTAQTLTLTFSQVSGTLLTTITNATGTGAYEGVPLRIRAQGATAITIQTAAGGTYTTVTYNISASIEQLAA